MKKRIIFSCCGLLVLILAAAGFYLFSSPQSPDIPEYEQLAEVQLNSIKAEAGSWEKTMITTLLDGMKAAQPVQRMQARSIKNDEDYYVIGLTDKDENRMCCHFFEYDGVLYMSVDHKNVYTDVDFIYSAISGWGPTGYGWSPLSRTSLIADVDTDVEFIRVAVETDYDVRTWLYNYVSAYMTQGVEKEDAVESGAEYILSRYKLYQYALENDYEIADSQYQKMIDDDLEAVKARDDFEEINAKYVEAGTTFEDYVAGNAAFLWKIEYTLDYMEYCITNQFREGEDTSYNSAGDYCNAYINHIVTNELDNIDTGAFEKELEEAKQYVSNSLG